jgi:hypothetical protein
MSPGGFFEQILAESIGGGTKPKMKAGLFFAR